MMADDLQLTMLATPVTVKAKVLRIHDGDTFTASVAAWPAIFTPMQFRLFGVDAPELHDTRPDIQAIAFKARDRLTELIGLKDVTLTIRAKDKFFRLDALIEVAGVEKKLEDVVNIMEREGLVRPYTGQGQKPW